MSKSFLPLIALFWLFFAFTPAIAAEPTVSIHVGVNDPALYSSPAPRQLTLELMFYLKQASPQEEKDLDDWLTGEGFRIVSSEYDSIVVDGSVEDAEQAFQVTIMMTRDGRDYGNLEDPKLPARFGDIVWSITGLSPVTSATSGPLRRKSVATPAPLPTRSGQPHSFNSGTFERSHC